MKMLSEALICFMAVCFCGVPVWAQQSNGKTDIAVPKGYRPPTMKRSARLQAILDAAVSETLTAFAAKGLKINEVAATLIDLRDPAHLMTAEIRGNDRIYPASVVKMFYMAALERQIEDGKRTMSVELERGLRDMIVVSSNEATQYILDVVTDTSSGAERPEKDFVAWQNKRNAVNRYFAAMGYTNINANQKTFCEDAYGVEQQSRNYKGENRNMLTTDATARLMAEIVLGRIVGSDGTKKMMDLMKRDPFAATADPDDQAHAFSGMALVERKLTDVKLWSKAGETSKTRHDAAYFETPGGQKFVLVVFTENHATDKQPVPMIVGKVLDKMMELKK